MAHCRIALCAFVLLAWAPHPGRRSVSLLAQPGSDISRRVLHPFVGLGGKGWVQSPPETPPELKGLNLSIFIMLSSGIMALYAANCSP